MVLFSTRLFYHNAMNRGEGGGGGLTFSPCLGVAVTSAVAALRGRTQEAGGSGSISHSTCMSAVVLTSVSINTWVRYRRR